MKFEFDGLEEKFSSTGLRDEELFSDVLKFFAVNIGNVVTPSLMTLFLKKKYCTLSHNTTGKYFKAIVENLKLVTPVDRYYIKKIRDKSTKKPHAHNKTYYFNDCSLLRCVLEDAYNDPMLYKSVNSNKCEEMEKRNELFLAFVTNEHIIKSGVYRYYSRKGDGNDCESSKIEKLLFCDIDIVAEKDGVQRNVVFPDEKQLDVDSVDHYILLHALKCSNAEGDIIIVDFKDACRVDDSMNIKIWGVKTMMDNIAKDFCL